METQSNRRCKYCGEKLYGEWAKGFGNCFWCANDNCKVKPLPNVTFAKRLRSLILKQKTTITEVANNINVTCQAVSA